MHYLLLDPDWTPAHVSPEDKIPVALFKFPAGEVHLKLAPRPSDPRVAQPYCIQICHRLRTGDDVMALLLAADALRAQYPNTDISAFLPYLPYARQDRRMVGGEPFSLKIMVQLLGLCRFDRVRSLDVHNLEVTGALFEAGTSTIFESIDPWYLRQAAVDITREFGDYVLLAPDAGAAKKVAKTAELLQYKGPILQGTKRRDLATGRIASLDVEATEAEVGGRTVWIQDDICSRGGTFMGLAKRLKALGAAHVVLSVAHWEGTADPTELMEAGIERVYTTNSLHTLQPNPGLEHSSYDGFIQQYLL